MAKTTPEIERCRLISQYLGYENEVNKINFL